ncbi:protein SCO1/2 [Streptoalloteichus tenebrarius]|uniref:Protein SCO1/2 n=1 Tax=Streptoalloteichus tenebrarius (strain ATCC 17920 / DSM 40477 / JCM 4838 / CBS 697.72 / NBRC 16177 / NCIMB 11028 / NRRL B-12390 / A12253. 1 / ISP 5477) TaxID=1933 RepID=A0ABT1HT15_STRSD|nr:SCO family protein [Streptoalloteichus tenebrarius]MCP2258674.1 protein SCO1/2 [Streptoalloteichus tenebrarius]BFF02819.1 SCO family protein [Streptoalloteichus tenebrarius]
MRALRCVASALLAGLLLASCGDPGSSAPAGTSTTTSAAALKAAAFPTPLEAPKPNLTDLQGRPFDFAQRLRDKVTLLYFGYANCPDVCPTTMGDIGQAVRKLDQSQRQRVQVVMVTSDPARDTPEAFGTWLRQFGPDFVGLTGKIDDIVAAAHSVNIGIEPPKTDAAGDYEVTHGAQVLLYTPDGKGAGYYRSGTSSDDMLTDLRTLLNR